MHLAFMTGTGDVLSVRAAGVFRPLCGSNVSVSHLASDWCRDSALLLHEVKSRRKKPVEEPHKKRTVLFERNGKTFQPYISQRLPIQVPNLAKDHADTTNRGRGRLLEILSFEHHRHRVTHLDDLRDGQQCVQARTSAEQPCESRRPCIGAPTRGTGNRT